MRSSIAISFEKQAAALLLSLAFAAAAAADCRSDPRASATVGYVTFSNCPAVGKLQVEVNGKPVDARKEGSAWRFDTAPFTISETSIRVIADRAPLWCALGGKPKPLPTGGCVAVYEVSCPMSSWYVRVASTLQTRVDYQRSSRTATLCQNAGGFRIYAPLVLPSFDTNETGEAHLHPRAPAVEGLPGHSRCRRRRRDHDPGA